MPRITSLPSLALSPPSGCLSIDPPSMLSTPESSITTPSPFSMRSERSLLRTSNSFNRKSVGDSSSPGNSISDYHMENCISRAVTRNNWSESRAELFRRLLAAPHLGRGRQGGLIPTARRTSQPIQNLAIEASEK